MIADSVRIAVLWRPLRNVEMQQAYSGLDIPDDAREEAELLRDGLREAGYHAFLLEWRPRDFATMFEILRNSKTDLVFNASSAQEVCFLHAAGLPYSGSGPGLVDIDKATRKMILAHQGVRTSPFVVVSPENGGRNNTLSLERLRRGWEPKPPLRYPLFVKPVEGRGSAGVSDDSIVDNLTSLVHQAEVITERMGQGALVENYLVGQEVTVGVVGDPPLPLPPLEIEYNGARTNTYEHKMDREIMHCPARLSPAVASNAVRTARAAFDALAARDFARVDMIVDREGRARVLELNTFAGLHILTGSERDLHASYIGAMAKASGLPAGELLGAIVSSALARYRPHEAKRSHVAAAR